MTPTEAAAVAVIYSIPVGFLIYRGLKLPNFLSAGREAATAVGTIMVMILFSMILSQMFVYESIPQQMVSAIFSVTENKILLLIFINILLFLVGMVVNDATAIILIAPLLLPLMTALGISPVQFAAIMGVNTAMGGGDAALCLHSLSRCPCRECEGYQDDPTGHVPDRHRLCPGGVPDILLAGPLIVPAKALRILSRGQVSTNLQKTGRNR